MISLPLGQLREIVCLGAHCDDIEIGCGGTMAKIVAASPGVRVRWVVFSSDPLRAREARASAEALLEGASAEISIEDFQGRYFPFHGAKIKEYFDRLGEEVDPDVVFTHYRDDLHQDHQLLSELTLNTFRDHLVLEYEIPKYDGDLGRPNAYVWLDEHACNRKIARILEFFESQRDKHWFTDETFRALLRLRGIECKAPDGYAEAFHIRKLVLA